MGRMHSFHHLLNSLLCHCIRHRVPQGGNWLFLSWFMEEFAFLAVLQESKPLEFLPWHPASRFIFFKTRRVTTLDFDVPIHLSWVPSLGQALIWEPGYRDEQNRKSFLSVYSCLLPTNQTRLLVRLLNYELLYSWICFLFLFLIPQYLHNTWKQVYAQWMFSEWNKEWRNYLKSTNWYATN